MSDYPPVQAGDLSHRITIIAATETVDSSGSAIEDWANPTVICTVWAALNIATRIAGERPLANTRVAETFYEATIRYRTDITVKHRVLEGSPIRTFDIIAVQTNFVQRNRWTRLILREHQNNG